MRVCTVWCPDWPVVAARGRVAPGEDGRAGPGAGDDRPVAVLGSDRGRHGRTVVIAASGEARAAGVVEGLARRAAEACCPGLLLVEADPAADARAFEPVARAIEALTPRVELERPGVLSFPTRGPSRFVGGDDALATRTRVALADAGVRDGRVGIADGRFTARLAARSEVVVDSGGSAAFLAALPVGALGDADLAGLLVRLGLRTLGDFAALPSAAVLARFGADGARAHRCARGLDPEPVALTPPPPDLVETTELDPPAVRVDVVAFAAKTMADRMLGRLADRGLACTRVVVEVETEHGEHQSRAWRHDTTLDAGALTATALADRVRWQLDGWRVGGQGPTGGLTLLRITPDEVVAATGRQLGFWGGDRAAAASAARALARVQGLLGPDAVVTAVPRGGRTPAERIRWVPWGEPRETLSSSSGQLAPWPGALPSPAPGRVLDPPWPATLLDAEGRPVVVSGRGEPSAPPAAVHCEVLPGGGGPVEAWAGPWVHDARWWDPRSRDRRARWQVLVAGVACLVARGGGRTTLEALYD